MNKLLNIALVWIVAWKVLTLDEGVKVVRHRTARFHSRAQAVEFMRSQAWTGRHYVLTQK